MRWVLISLTLLLGIGSVFIIRGNILSPNVQTFTLETERITTLEPHGHEVGHDSVTDGGHHVRLYSPSFVSAEDVWVSGIEFELVNAPASVLHHGNVRIMGEPDRLCPKEVDWGRRIIAFGEDQVHTPYPTFPEGYAILIPAGKPIRLEAMLHNPLPPVGHGGIYHNVSVRVRLHSIKPAPEHLPQQISFQLLHLQDVPCGDTRFVFSVPPKSIDFHFMNDSSTTPTASRMVFERPARIIYWGAHLHGWEGGKELIVRKNGEPIALFETRRASDDPYRFDTPHLPADISVEAGDSLSIEAVYDNPRDETIRGAMGHLGIYFVGE